MIRFFIRAMHNRPGEGVQSREACALELGVIAPVVAVIVALGVYPQVILEGSEQACRADAGAASRARARSTLRSSVIQA